MVAIVKVATIPAADLIENSFTGFGKPNILLMVFMVSFPIHINNL
jgi:hypothetical protein